jgi:hypothetical protein
VRALDVIVVSCIARIEVAAAIRKKQRIGELTDAAATTLTAEFEADYFGTHDTNAQSSATCAPHVVHPSDTDPRVARLDRD